MRIPLDADVRVLTLHQPWASLWADPRLPKTIETRGSPFPSTIPLPAWVLVNAAARKPNPRDLKALILDRFDVWNAWHAAGYVSDDGALDCIPVGCIVGAVHVTGCYPMLRANQDPHHRNHIVVAGTHPPHNLVLCRAGMSTHTTRGIIESHFEYESHVIEHERPFGLYEPGRFGYDTDRQVVLPVPIPWKGGQLWSQRAPIDLIRQFNTQLRKAA